MTEEVRIDKWLWSVRLYKTRSQAAEACRAGKVKLNGVPVKSSHDVKVGEVYEITIEQLHKVVEVKALLGNRVGAKLVPDFMNDLTPAEEYERIQMIRQYNFERRDRGTGRPTKRESRDLDEFKYSN